MHAKLRIHVLAFFTHLSPLLSLPLHLKSGLRGRRGIHPARRNTLQRTARPRGDFTELLATADKLGAARLFSSNHRTRAAPYAPHGMEAEFCYVEAVSSTSNWANALARRARRGLCLHSSQHSAHVPEHRTGRVLLFGVTPVGSKDVRGAACRCPTNQKLMAMHHMQIGAAPR
jgi:hypothetical protein